MMAKDAQWSARPGGEGPCACLAREALGRLASPEVRDRILEQALAAAGLDRVPDDPAAFGSFACGPMREAVVEALGEDAAAAVISDLSPAFTHDGPSASSGVRRRKGASLAAPRSDAPVALIASDDPKEVDALVARLKDRAKVIAAYDVFALLSAASRHLTAPLTLLLNDGMPAVRPSTLATLARVLPPGTRIIVWGKGNVEPEKRAETPAVEWVRLGPVEDIEAVADVCLAMWPSTSVPPAALQRPGPRRRVVLAHDDAAFRARVGRMLDEAGYAVASAPDGFMALEHCIDEMPVAVVAALHMSTLDGAQLAALLRSRFGDDSPPVLLVASGPLPEPPPGVMAMIRSDSIDDDLLPELAAWVGTG